jgi:hypothetical protein
VRQPNLPRSTGPREVLSLVGSGGPAPRSSPLWTARRTVTPARHPDRSWCSPTEQVGLLRGADRAGGDVDEGKRTHISQAQASNVRAARLDQGDEVRRLPSRREWRVRVAEVGDPRRLRRVDARPLVRCQTRRDHHRQHTHHGHERSPRHGFSRPRVAVQHLLGGRRIARSTGRRPVSRRHGRHHLVGLTETTPDCLTSPTLGPSLIARHDERGPVLFTHERRTGHVNRPLRTKSR